MSSIPRNTDAAADTRNLFKQHFGYTPAHIVQVPGCIVLLGDYADDNDGLALTAAVDRYLCIAASPRTDGKIELISSAFPGRELFWLTDLKQNPAAAWADPVKGVLEQLRQRGVHFSGFNVAIHNAIPTGQELGSEAALRIATALTVRQLFPFSLTETGVTLPPKRDERGRLPALARTERFHLARLCRAAEAKSVVVGVANVDLLSSLLGKAWNVLSIDCRFGSVDQTPLIGEALIICDTGVRRAVSAELEMESRSSCKSAAEKFRAKSLRSVEPKLLAANKDKLTAREYECAYHVVGEIQRVAAAERALRDDDHRQLGQYLFQSHESARDFLKHSTTEQDLLIERARVHPGCLGARRLGVGLAGATLNLVAYHQADDFIRVMASRFEERTGQKLMLMVCQVVDGAA